MLGGGDDAVEHLQLATPVHDDGRGDVPGSGGSVGKREGGTGGWGMGRKGHGDACKAVLTDRKG